MTRSIKHHTCTIRGGAHCQINKYSINSLFPTWTLCRDSSKIEEAASADPAIRLQRIGHSRAYWNNAPVLVGSAGIASGFQHYSWHFQEIQSGKVSRWPFLIDETRKHLDWWQEIKHCRHHVRDDRALLESLGGFDPWKDRRTGHGTKENGTVAQSHVAQVTSQTALLN